jgi:hypothetical protein
MFLREAGGRLPQSPLLSSMQSSSHETEATVPPEAPSGDNKRLVINGLGYLTLSQADTHYRSK